MRSVGSRRSVAMESIMGPGKPGRPGWVEADRARSVVVEYAHRSRHRHARRQRAGKHTTEVMGRATTGPASPRPSTCTRRGHTSSPLLASDSASPMVKPMMIAETQPMSPSHLVPSTALEGCRIAYRRNCEHDFPAQCIDGRSPAPLRPREARTASRCTIAHGTRAARRTASRNESRPVERHRFPRDDHNRRATRRG